MNVFAYRSAWAAVRLGADRAELLVALAVADHADRMGRAWPGRSTIATMTGLSEASVKRALGRLRALGVLVVMEEGRGRGRKTVYAFAASGAEKGSQVIPFPERKGVTGDPLKRAEKGSNGTAKRGQGAHTGTIRFNHARGGAREADPSTITGLRAERLADMVRRKGAAALVLPEWRDQAVARIAVERHGADPALLRALGVDAPLDLRRAADG